MSQYKILITGTGGGGVGEGLYKSLEPLSKYTVYNCNSSENSLFLFHKHGYSFIVPSAKSNNYTKVILNICKENNIKCILPGSEPELVILSNNRAEFEKEGILIFANTSDVIKTFNNKWETFVKLKALNVKTPDTTLDIEDVSFFERNRFPLIVKPIYGNASKNIFTIQSFEELTIISEYFRLKKIAFVIQEYVGQSEEEFTISVLSDFSGQYLGSIVLKRILAGGYSQYIECEEFDELEAEAKIVAGLVGSKGPINLQCRIVSGKLCVFEINPRFSGTTPFRALLGFNEADVFLSKVLENKIIFEKKRIKYGSFGVRGFKEEIYSNYSKYEVKRYY